MYVAAIAHLGMLPGIFISILRIFFTNLNTFPGKFWLWTSAAEKTKSGQILQKMYTYGVDVCVMCPPMGPSAEH